MIGVSEDKLDSHSPSRVYEKLGKTIPQGVAAGIDGDAQKAVDATKRMTAAVEAVYQASSQKTKKSIEEQMKDLVELGEKYDEEVENLWTELGESIAAVQDKYDQELESRTQSIMSSLGLFDVAQKNTEATSRGLTKALESQIDLLEDYNIAIANLAGRGVDSEFLDEIKALGIDATGEIEALNSMSDEELAKYVDMWKEKSNLARTAATEELTTLKEDTLTEIGNLTSEAVIKYEKLRADYQEQARLLATELAAAMKASGNAGYKELASQLDAYTQVGQDLMSGTVTGVTMESPALARAVATAVSNAIRAAKRAAGIKSPSRVMREEVGKNLVLGLEEGWDAEIDGTKTRFASDIGDMTAKVQATVAAEGARMSYSAGNQDTGIYDLARAVGTQTAGINSLAGEYRRGTGNTRPIVLMLDRRELGRAVIDVGSEEEIRTGLKLVPSGV